MAWMTGMPGRGDAAPPAPARNAVPFELDRAEELANSITHGVGVVLSIAGLYGLVLITGNSHASGHALGCQIYGASLVLLYTASTLYHGWRDDEMRRVLLLLDHIGIYVLIAGTYTPMVLIPLRSPLGWGLLVLAWGFALVGSILKVGRIHSLHEDSPIPDLAMGSMWLAASGQLVAMVPPGELLWFLGGGVAYVIGLIFFINDGRRFNHTIWHLFVLAGSICHYRAVIGYVLVMPA
jgi:hemolysin III